DFNPTDLDWRELISEWPDLHEVAYWFTGWSERDTYRRLDPGPRATIKTLMGFSRSHRQLRSLNVPVTVASYDTDAALRADVLPFSRSLHSIHFDNYSIEDDAVDGLAMLLLCLTHDDVVIWWQDPDSVEDRGLDTRNEMNGRDTKKLIDFARKMRLMGFPRVCLASGDVVDT
ncbi:hypothetical protein FRC01_010935, partial [Tulasnella sp. 417]